MGGELSFESEVGLGSRFCFTLLLQPVQNSGEQSSVERQVVRLAEGYQVKALVADDITHNREVLARFLSEPLLAENIYDCLARLLHIEYQYEKAHLPPLELAQIVLPAPLFKRLKEAAELGEVTELEAALEAVKQRGEEGRQLAEQLLQLSRNLEIDAILDILGELNHDCKSEVKDTSGR